MSPFGIGLCPPARTQITEYAFRGAHVTDFPESLAALPASGPSPSRSRRLAGNTISHCNATSFCVDTELNRTSNATPCPGAPATGDICKSCPTMAGQPAVRTIAINKARVHISEDTLALCSTRGRWTNGRFQQRSPLGAVGVGLGNPYRSRPIGNTYDGKHRSAQPPLPGR